MKVMITESINSLRDIDRHALTIFQQEWWLNVARGSAHLEEVQVLGPKSQALASFAYIVQRNAIGIPSGTDPYLSRVGGPVLKADLSDPEKETVLSQLIEKLPNISFRFSISENAPNAHLIRQGFQRAGFECFEQINYSQPPEDEINRLGAKLREHIRQAKNVIDIGPEEFINFYQENLKSIDNQKCYFPLEVARELIEASINREPPQARIIAATQKSSYPAYESTIIDAAICVVWDSDRYYYWLSTRRKQSHPDAIKLLITTAMRHANILGLVFDADGINTPGTQRLFNTIFKMSNLEKRYVLTRASKSTKLYEYFRYKFNEIKKVITPIDLKQLSRFR
jgi:hypothetical protein